MGRKPKPWYRTGTKAWCVVIDGKLHTLVKGPKTANEKVARKVFEALMSARARGELPAADEVTVGELVTAYLKRQLQKAEANTITPGSYAADVRWLGQFRERFARQQPSALVPAAVEDWLAEHSSWGPTTRHHVATTVKAVFRWARRTGRLSKDPLDGLEKPPRTQRREIVMDEATWQLIRAHIRSDEFRALADFIHDTGCRPGEACRLEARHVDWERGVAVLPGKQTRRTGRNSQLVIPERVAAWLRPLCEDRPAGPLFRTASGRAWNKDSINCQMRMVRRRAGLGPDSGAVSYALRHLFATDALAAGVPAATVATALNHGDMRMVMRNYSHLAQRTEHLRAAVEAVRPVAPSAGAPAPEAAQTRHHPPGSGEPTAEPAG